MSHPEVKLLKYKELPDPAGLKKGGTPKMQVFLTMCMKTKGKLAENLV